MPRNDFQARLVRAMERGNLRVADIARWFGRRHSTVRGWVIDGREPAGTAADVRGLFAHLVQLEDMTRQRSLSGRPLRSKIAEARIVS